MLNFGVVECCRPSYPTVIDPKQMGTTLMLEIYHATLTNRSLPPAKPRLLEHWKNSLIEGE